MRQQKITKLKSTGQRVLPIETQCGRGYKEVIIPDPNTRPGKSRIQLVRMDKLVAETVNRIPVSP